MTEDEFDEVYERLVRWQWVREKLDELQHAAEVRSILKHKESVH